MKLSETKKQSTCLDTNNELLKLRKLEHETIGRTGEARICNLFEARASQILSATKHLWEIQPGRGKSCRSAEKLLKQG